MSLYAYIRVSTEKQDQNLDNQFELILDFLEQNNLNLTNVITETSSAYYSGQLELNKLLELKNITIIVTDISRLSRNTNNFKEYTNKMITNNIKLISIKERINGSLNDTTLFLKVLSYVDIYQSQVSSIISGIKKKVNDNWDFRKDKFGKKIIYQKNIRKVIDDHNEVKVIELIKALKRETKSSVINNYLCNVIPENKTPLELVDRNGNVTEDLIENKLDYNTIANILNSYKIFNRGKKWNIKSIDQIIKLH